MRGNVFGKLLSMTSFGESHGAAMGVVLDGIPAGLPVHMEHLKRHLERRAPGRSHLTTSRAEEDLPEILSGVFADKTLGTPLAVIVRNTQQRSQDYTHLENFHRPGHADRTTLLKFGRRDHRGGGRSSGRETVARVIAGYFAALVLPQVLVKAYAHRVGPFESLENPYLLPLNLADLDAALLLPDLWGPLHFPDANQRPALEEFLLKCKQQGDSVGGTVMILVDGCPVGLGEPVFEKLKADLAKALLSIGACTSFSYGLGEDFAHLRGQEISSDTANFGGMEGGISNGERLVMSVTFKAPSTIGENSRTGRHDPCVIPRAIPVVESMVRFVLADHYLRQRAYVL